MLKKYFLFVFLLSSLSVHALDDYMFFRVNDFEMSRVSLDDRFSGTVLAHKIKVAMENQYFELNSDEHGPFSAITYIENDYIYFKNNQLTFGTPLFTGNPVSSLTSLRASDSDIELAKDRIVLDSSIFEFTIKNLLVQIESALIICDTGGEFSTSIDLVCLNNSVMEKRGEEAAKLLINYSDKADLNIEFELDDFNMKQNFFSGNVLKINGNYNQLAFELDNGFLECAKFENVLLDPEIFIKGCLLRSIVKSERLAFQGDAFSLEIKGADLEITEDRYRLNADSAKFFAGSQTTDLSIFKIDCHKMPVTLETMDTNILLKAYLLRIFQLCH